MAYALSWYIPEHVLCLSITGQPTLQELEEINQEVIKILDTCNSKVSLLINAGELKSGYQTTNQLRDSQKYGNHTHMESILVVSDNKLTRLVTLMAFGVSKAFFMQFNDFARVEDYLKRRGFMMSNPISAI